ncbi:YoaK family protein [Agrococcus citreus]|uniref:YoaK family protein n=1 Tax=Agrococcus citreus TaxID=84643 RepID=A0ABP4JI10_9MICO
MASAHASEAHPSAGARIRAHVRGLAGPDRTVRSNRDLAVLLALTAGIVNSVGFMAIALYTSHMTGLTAMLADMLATGAVDIALLCLIGIVAFVAGAAACAMLFNWGRRRGLRSRYANVLLVEAVLVLLVGLLAQELSSTERSWALIALLGLTMGLQNAIITKISNAQIRTTHVTGMITDIGIELGKLAYPTRRGDPEPVRADLGRLGLHTLLVGTFFAGGLLGALAYSAIGFLTVVPTACILLAFASVPLVDDLRAAARARSRRGRMRPVE